MARAKSTLNATEGEEQQGSLKLTNPPTQSAIVREARSKPEGQFRLYSLSFPIGKEPAVLKNRDSAEKRPQDRTKDDYIYFSKVAIKCKDYIGDSLGFNEIPDSERSKLISIPYANLTADNAAGKAEGRGFQTGDRILLPKVGASYGIIFKGQITQIKLENAPDASPIKGNVVRVRVPHIVRAYHMLEALSSAVNVSTAAKAAIVGLVLPGGRRILWGDLDQTQIDG